MRLKTRNAVTWGGLLLASLVLPADPIVRSGGQTRGLPTNALNFGVGLEKARLRSPHPGPGAPLRGIRSSPQPEVAFEPNVGQASPRTKFLAHSGSSVVFLTGNGIALSLPSRRLSAFTSQTLRRPWSLAPGLLQKTSFVIPPLLSLSNPQSLVPSPRSLPSGNLHLTPETIRLLLVGANPHPKMIGLDKLKGISNYFIGNDPKKWRTKVPNYGRVLVKDVYPGIDMLFYGKDSGSRIQDSGN